jgi:hypothetical protein
LLCIPKSPVLLYCETQPLALSRHRPIFDVAFSPAPASCRGPACNRKSTTVNRPLPLPFFYLLLQSSLKLQNLRLQLLHCFLTRKFIHSTANNPSCHPIETRLRRLQRPPTDVALQSPVKRSKSSLAVRTALAEVRIPLQPTQALSPLRPPKLSGAVSLLPPSACRALRTRPHLSAPSAPARKASRVPTLVRLTKVPSRMTRLRPPQVSPTRRLQGV